MCASFAWPLGISAAVKACNAQIKKKTEQNPISNFTVWHQTWWFSCETSANEAEAGTNHSVQLGHDIFCMSPSLQTQLRK